MSISDSFVAELKHEAATTRKLLERVPDDRLTWKPHDKSWSFIQLASHVVSLLEWVQPTLDLEEMVLPDEYKPWTAASSQELVRRFDANIAKAVERLTGFPDSEMMKPWKLKGPGAEGAEQVYFTLPRVAVIRSFVINHLIHHRGQLSIYLRLNDIPMPAIYGPSADES
jgi:uncharacterized damage-inducible protein DinB